jgi:hypothetical protein
MARQAYRKRVGKLLHVTRWIRPDIMNSVRELSRFAGGALEPSNTLEAEVEGLEILRSTCDQSGPSRIALCPGLFKEAIVLASHWP